MPTDPTPSRADRRPRTSRRADAALETRDRLLDATERLMDRTPFAQLSVAQVLSEADVSRATFYTYFGSKFDVLKALLERTMEDVFGTVQPFLARAADEDPAEALRRSLTEVTRLWRERRMVLEATNDHWREVPDLGAVWLGIVERFIAAGAQEIARERASGLVPDGPTPRQLAAVLFWGTERTLHITGLGIEPSLADDAVTVETLVRVWSGTLYGSDPARTVA